MKLLKKLFGIKITYAIPSDNGVDITKGKRYVVVEVVGNWFYIRDNSKVKILIKPNSCLHINGGNWKTLIE